MSDTMEQAADLTNKYEQGLMPGSEEATILNEFFEAIDDLEAQLDAGEITPDELASAIKELRQKSKASAIRTLGSPAVSSLKSQNSLASESEGYPTLTNPSDSEDDPEDVQRDAKYAKSKQYDSNYIPRNNQESWSGVSNSGPRVIDTNPDGTRS